MKNPCEFTGCKKPARWECKKLVGKGRMIWTCDDHKPDMANRPESLKHLPFTWEVRPLDPTR